MKRRLPICASTRGPKNPSEIMLKKRCHQPPCTNMYVANDQGCCRMYTQCGTNISQSLSPGIACDDVSRKTMTLAMISRFTHGVRKENMLPDGLLERVCGNGAGGQRRLSALPALAPVNLP